MSCLSIKSDRFISYLVLDVYSFSPCILSQNDMETRHVSMETQSKSRNGHTPSLAQRGFDRSSDSGGMCLFSTNVIASCHVNEVCIFNLLLCFCQVSNPYISMFQLISE